MKASAQMLIDTVDDTLHVSLLPYFFNDDTDIKRRGGILDRAHGVVGLSRPLSMREVLGSIPNVSIMRQV